MFVVEEQARDAVDARAPEDMNPRRAHEDLYLILMGVQGGEDAAQGPQELIP